MAKDLRVGIYDALYEWGQIDIIPPGEAKDKQIARTKKCANDIGDAVRDYLLENTWTITDMKANVQVDHIKTPDRIPVDVEPDTLAGPYSPMLGAIKKLGFDLMSPVRSQIQKVVESGAFTRNLQLHKYNLFKQGGMLDAKGQAYIGPSDTTRYSIKDLISDPWYNKSTVQLNPKKLKLDKEIK
tara:strand:+ start:228 stop:779 length:552 start_codon:yes stop_codon:yes gene_type:complete